MSRPPVPRVSVLAAVSVTVVAATGAATFRELIVTLLTFAVGVAVTFALVVEVPVLRSVSVVYAA